jgi:hypothetical protein
MGGKRRGQSGYAGLGDDDCLSNHNPPAVPTLYTYFLLVCPAQQIWAGGVSMDAARDVLLSESGRYPWKGSHSRYLDCNITLFLSATPFRSRPRLDADGLTIVYKREWKRISLGNVAVRG